MSVVGVKAPSRTELKLESITGYRSCCCSIWRWPYFLPNAKDMAETIFNELLRELGKRDGKKALYLTIGEDIESQTN